MNCHYFEGRDAAPEKLIDLAQTLPFLAERRVLIIEDSGLFKKGGELLADYFKDMAQTAYFVFAEQEIDKRSRLYKAVREVGRLAEFTVQSEATLQRWVAGMAAKERKRMEDRDIRYFLEKTGTDMANIRTEMEKLLCYTLEREQITAEDVDEICTRHVSNQIFDMVGAVAEKNGKRALELYYDLLALREPPMRILFLLARQFNLLLQVKLCKKKGCDNRTTAERTGLREFLIGKYAAQAARFETEGLREALNACVEAEERVKTGKMDDVMSVELLIVRYGAKA